MASFKKFLTGNGKYKYLHVLLVVLVIVGLLGSYVIPKEVIYATEGLPTNGTWPVTFYGYDPGTKELVVISNQDVEHGESAVEPNPGPAPEGYKFGKWDTSSANVTRPLDIRPLFDLISQPGDEDGDSAPPAGSPPASYTITFKGGSGSGEELVIEGVEPGVTLGDAVGAPPVLAPNPNFTFTGWIPAWSAGDLVEGDMVFEAQWTQGVAGDAESKLDWNKVLKSGNLKNPSTNAVFSIPGNAEKLTFTGASNNGKTYLDYVYMICDDEGNITLYFLASAGNKMFLGGNSASSLSYSGIPGTLAGRWYDSNNKIDYGVYMVYIPEKDIDKLQSGIINLSMEGAPGQSIMGETLKFTNLYFTEHYTYTDDINAASLKVTLTRTGVPGREVTARPISITGYTYDETNVANIKSGTIVDGQKLVLKLYYTRSGETFRITITGVSGTAEYTGSPISLGAARGPDAGALYTVTVDGAHPDDVYRIVGVVTGDNPSRTDVGVSEQDLRFAEGVKIYYVSGPKKTQGVVGEEDFTDLFGNLANNEGVTVRNGTLTVTPIEVTITAADKTKVYGDDDPELTATIVGLLGGDTLNYTLSRVAGENVGDYEINVTLGENPNYTVKVVDATFTITKKAVTVTAADKNKVYGDDDPELTAVVAGLKEGDTLNYTLSRAAGENVGDYEINVTLGNNPNYEVTVVDATFTITQKDLTITADDKTKVFGQGDPGLTATIVGLKEGDTLNYTLSRVDGEDVGDYDINVTLGNNPNYNITANDGTFTITPKAVLVKADDKIKVYGDDDSPLTATVTDDAGADVVTYTMSRAPGQDVGTYTIYVEITSSNPNYKVTKEDGTLTINPRPVSIIAIDNGKVYGEDDPALEVEEILGLVGNDTLDFSIGRAAGENVGDYVISVTPGDNPNYDVTVVDATFTITKRVLTITADPKSKVYGDDDPDLTATIVGLVEGDTLNYSLSRAAGENVAEYAISVTLGENPNYSITETGSTFTITPKAVTITADDKTKEFGQDDPELTATIEGLKEGDTLSYSLSREPGQDVDTYVISVMPGTNPNYEVKVVDGTFTITPIIVTVTAIDNSKTYGEEDPELAVTVTGADAGDINYSFARAPGEDVGTYVITVTLGENPNYIVNAVNGEFKINPLAIDVGDLDPSDPTDPTDPSNLTAEDLQLFTKVYGDPDPALDKIEELIQNAVRERIAAKYDGVPGVNVNDFTVSVTGRELGEGVGVYAYEITVSANGNYKLTENVTASLTIIKADLTIISATDSFIFDGDEKTNPNVTVEGLVNGDTYDGLVAIGRITNPGTVDNRIDEEGAEFISSHGAIGDNYNVEIIIGKLTVKASGITVEYTAGNATSFTKVYGDADPATVQAEIQARVSEQLKAQGLSGDDIVVTVNGRAEGETVSGSPYAYDITYTIADDLSYEFGEEIVIRADLSILKRPITVTADSGEKIFDGDPLTNDGFTFDNDALVNGETVVSAIVKGSQTNVLRDAEGNVIGSPNAASGAVIMGGEDGEDDVTSNYAITYIDGTLTVYPAPLVITVLDQTVYQGTVITKFDLTAAVFRAGDDFTVLSGKPNYLTEYTPAARAGQSFEVEVEGITAANYEIEFVPGLINVIARGGGGTPGGGEGGTEPTTGGGGTTGGGEAVPVEVTTTINGMETPLAGTITPISADRLPLANVSSWALLNLILTLVTALIMAFLLIAAVMNRRKEDEEDEEYDEDREKEKVKKYMGLRLLSVLATVIAVLLFIFTQDMRLPMVFADMWSIWHVVIVAAAVLLAWFSRKKYEEDDEDLEKETI